MCYTGFNEMRVGMKIENINVTETIAQARKMLKDNKKVPVEFAVLFSLLLTVLEALLERLNKNSKNSSIPPSQDPNRAKDPKSKAAKSQADSQGRWEKI